jgi:TPR repeat protein
MQTAKFLRLSAGTPDALAQSMEHSDFTPAVSFSLPARASFSPRSPHRSIWLSALSFGMVGCILAIWGTPLTPAPAASAPAAAALSDNLASRCESGDASACNDQGVTALHSVPSDASLAVRSFERACQGGSADACSNLGALAEAGVGVRSNLSDAARLYEQACTGGAALGCSNLGALYARGKGVARDASEAQRLFSLACDGGSAAGCSNLMQLTAR